MKTDGAGKKSLALKALRGLYEKLFKINDSAQKIALGFALGVFAGIIPGTGPVASLFLAFIFRANRASAILGSIISNTWSSIITFLLAIKIGSGILNTEWQEVYHSFGSGYHGLSFFKSSFTKVILPIFVGYIVIGLILGLLAYIVTLGIIYFLRKK